jgi:hypothetical protein
MLVRVFAHPIVPSRYDTVGSEGALLWVDAVGTNDVTVLDSSGFHCRLSSDVIQFSPTVPHFSFRPGTAEDPSFSQTNTSITDKRCVEGKPHYQFSCVWMQAWHRTGLPIRR